ncbi:MAG: Co2+/Mg2+ efflux protein ApaG [Myxococcota bacterium]
MLERVSSDTTTDGVRIQVEVNYLHEQSVPSERHWLFAYSIRISNFGREPVQLINRHWVITDGWGNEQEVRGPGVVGETPRLQPGESFEYTSFCPLSTPTGEMRGCYEMKRDDGSLFDAEIQTFYLRDSTHMN